MTPNLRSLVAKAYRVHQGRTFSSSSAPNPIDSKGKGFEFNKGNRLYNMFIWFAAGYSSRIGLEMNSYYNAERKWSDLRLEYTREMIRYCDEMKLIRSPGGLSEE